jgi:mono/diheme cytochrome c family protein
MLRVYLAKGNCKMLMSPTMRSGALVMLIALLRSPGTTVAVPPPSSVQASGTGADATAGKQLFERHCALCHGIEGKGGRGPGLNRVQLAHAPDDTALKSIISDGISPDMPAGWFLTDEDAKTSRTWQLTCARSARSHPSRCPAMPSAVLGFTPRVAAATATSLPVLALAMAPSSRISVYDAALPT